MEYNLNHHGKKSLGKKLSLIKKKILKKSNINETINSLKKSELN